MHDESIGEPPHIQLITVVNLSTDGVAQSSFHVGHFNNDVDVAPQEEIFQQTSNWKCKSKMVRRGESAAQRVLIIRRRLFIEEGPTTCNEIRANYNTVFIFAAAFSLRYDDDQKNQSVGI